MQILALIWGVSMFVAVALFPPRIAVFICAAGLVLGVVALKSTKIKRIRIMALIGATLCGAGIAVTSALLAIDIPECRWTECIDAIPIAEIRAGHMTPCEGPACHSVR